MSRPTRPTRIGALAGILALVASPVVAQAPQAQAAPAPAPAPTSRAAAAAAAPPKITWKRCGPMQCGEMEVPLVHGDPSQGTITLWVSRRPADRQDKKKGVLFVNPGGPGGSAVWAVPAFAQILGRSVRRQFDIVGVDPRGVGGSDIALCEGKPGEQYVGTDVMFPWKDGQYQQFFARDNFIRKMCLNSRPKILAHMTTADVARDMDLVRAALGQEKLNYYGVSYGSYLGATYANLFPERVRTMVVDGVLDPVAWATGRGDEAKTLPTTTRIGSDIGAHEALMAAIAECENVGPSACAEHATIREDWAALTGRLRNDAIVIGQGPDAFTIGYDFIIAITLSSLYDPEAVPDLLTFIHEFRQIADGGSPQLRMHQATPALERAYAKLKARDAENRKNRIAYDPPVPEEMPAPAYMPTFEGVVCSETRNPSKPSAWITAGQMADRRAPGFGPLWTWTSSVCAGIPNSPSAYHGPFTTRPAGGILVMSTKHDPATPYAGARAMHEMSTGSRMVTVDGWGHATLDSSGCATKVRNSYLLSGELPKQDRACKADHALFTSFD